MFKKDLLSSIDSRIVSKDGPSICPSLIWTQQKEIDCILKLPTFSVTHTSIQTCSLEKYSPNNEEQCPNKK